MENWQNDTITLNGCLLSRNNRNELQPLSDSIELWQHAISLFLDDWFNDFETITVHTSGSTGKPKEIQLTKTAMLNSARMTNSFFGLNETSTALLCLPASYIAGKMMLVRALVGGFNLITVEPTVNPFKDLHQRIDFMAITPYQLTQSLLEIKELENKKIEIGKIIVGGAKINGDLESELQSLKTVFYETYGMTETCSHIALRAINGCEKSDNFHILNGVSIRANEHNCLCITAPHLLQHEIVTNDIVKIHNKNAFKWLGRFDNVINSGGVKIYPEVVEQKLENKISQPFFISSAPDETLGNMVILVIESAPFTPQAEANLKTTLDATLDKYERPKTIIYIPQFRYSASNKLLKTETLRML